MSDPVLIAPGAPARPVRPVIDDLGERLRAMRGIDAELDALRRRLFPDNFNQNNNAN